MRRIAILPGNILIPDTSVAWLRTALPLVLQADLVTAAHVSASLSESESQAYQAQSSETLVATVERRNSKYEINVVVTDLSAQKAQETFLLTRNDSGGLVGAADAVARHIDPNATNFSTSSDRALQSYTNAVTSSDLQARMTGLQQAIQQDPGFGLAYFSAMETMSGRNGEVVQTFLRQASANSARFTFLDQQRLKAIAARLTGQPITDQANAAAALVKTTPNSLDALVGLASLRFLQGDAAQGKELIREGLSISPGNVALRSYLAQGLVQSRDFREAERVYGSLQGDPAMLPPLAACVLLEGDSRRADGIFEKFVAMRQQTGDPAVALLRANWLSISGHLPEAIALLKGASFSSPDLHSLALSQSAIWELMGNDLVSARKDSGASLRMGTSPGVQALANAADAICSGADSVDSLRAHVNSAPLQQDQRATVLAYGLFLAGHFEDAAIAWKKILEASGGTDLRSRAMLAASLERSGKTGQSGPLPVQPFIPNLTSDDQFGAAAFREMRRLLGR